MAQFNKNTQNLLSSNKSLYEVTMLADQQGNVINSFGAASNIPIAGGLVDGYSHINKFGYRNTVPSTYETIWDGATAYAYQAPAPITVTSGTPLSDDGGTVEVQGLDENYLPVTEVMTIGGAPSIAQFSRVFRAKMIVATTGDTNVDDITITNVVPVAIILAGNGQTLMSLYTIPAGKTGYLLKISGSIDANNDALFQLVARPFGNSFNVKGQFGVFASGFNYDYPVPLAFTEKTDIEVRGKSQNNVGAGAIFDLILVDN